ncbi:MAG: RIP metalloprotease RseP [Candidatus Magasanikbacteria bacterium RIFCSPHIGHO2_01_FULL_50_8]|uniref:Zinc metalloprotease n=1 Tax=Candidatus Magasanikbacteria bacterium RIFCSPHIGHO2_01_FULL_50_8 TaxID=1798674 RepID=A0A1F6LRH5_9BACT|nr:MAG: RIP metalloprotease RseP [Candidatus Magasanikbacteria bacterium RIFCSPHIGHO2_01_FULL_50_8]
MIGSFLVSVLSFVAVLFVLVLVHEWGHFFAARRFGVRVYEFGFGFPPRIKAWMRHGTEYTANWIPLGGFVRLKGEDGSDAHDADSFAHKKAWQRLVILLAGVVMNFVLGFAVYVGLFIHGVDMPIAVARDGAIIENSRVIVGGLIPDSPAARAGLQPGDQILNIAGMPITRDADVPTIVQSNAGRAIPVVVSRKGATLETMVQPALLETGSVGIGVRVLSVARVSYPIGRAFVAAAAETGDVSLIIFKTLGTIVGKLFTSGELQEGVSGPVGIAVVTGKVAQAGWAPLLQLVAMLSINLGILNVLPIPALDGGRAVFVLLEKVIGRGMRARVERVAQLVGFVLLITLVLAVTYRDILGLIN